jgi:tRNA splicing endonuclease
MGSILHHDIDKYIKNYEINLFIETGTGLGNSFQHAQKFDFKKLFTIEMVDELYLFSSTNLKKDNSFFIHAESKDGLRNVISQIDTSDKILFWLDAHFPGADFGLSNYHDIVDTKLRIPLEEELKTIVEKRDCSKDVFIIDDLRIYEDGPFEDGVWVERELLGGEGIDFIFEIFSTTHQIYRDYRDQGYIIVTPKKNQLEMILCTQ